jgi:predicted component of type VI protein secretion system
MRAQLIPLDGSPSVEIIKDLTLVGRRADCDLRLRQPGVSRIHCVLARTDGLLLLRDLGSTNGTHVNGERARRAALLPNDHLMIASVAYRIFLGPGTPPPAVEPVAGITDAQLRRRRQAEDSQDGPTLVEITPLDIEPPRRPAAAPPAIEYTTGMDSGAGRSSGSPRVEPTRPSCGDTRM